MANAIPAMNQTQTSDVISADYEGLLLLRTDWIQTPHVWTSDQEQLGVLIHARIAVEEDRRRRHVVSAVQARDSGSLPRSPRLDASMVQDLAENGDPFANDFHMNQCAEDQGGTQDRRERMWSGRQAQLEFQVDLLQRTLLESRALNVSQARMLRQFRHDRAEEAGPKPVVGVVAGVAKSIATKSAFAASSLGKGFLKWWFSLPVKLFRPHTVNPWTVVNHMAATSGQKAGLAYMRTVVAEEGYGFLGRNVAPLLFANAAAGAVLFNVYASTITALAPASAGTAAPVEHHPFIAGAFAGAATALISTPIDNIKASISPADIVAGRHDGMLRFTRRTCRNALKDDKTLWQKTRKLYVGIGHLGAKDALGFGTFFFLFENIRKHAKGAVADVWNLKEPSTKTIVGSTNELPPRRSVGLVIANATAVILSGGIAGMGYQAVIYPIDNIPSVLASSSASDISRNPQMVKVAAQAAAPIYEDGFHNANTGGTVNGARFQWKEVWEVARQKGVRPFYSGIMPQLVRVMPPSALGLFAYEVASSQFWDNDES
ncbi:hypothetical protein HKX48_003923 [Thoreauomyces humboldtii]|nr:hypothetical protein HKX48_003923 [Thoreauomyces humboldtii]